MTIIQIERSHCNLAEVLEMLEKEFEEVDVF